MSIRMEKYKEMRLERGLRKRDRRAMELLSKFVVFIDTYRIPPTFREMASEKYGIGAKSASAVVLLVKYLIGKGYLFQPLGPVSRGTIPTERGELVARHGERDEHAL